MKTHCRCRSCQARRVLKQHPEEYLKQPKCGNCGARDWRKDKYRHSIEMPLIRTKRGRYSPCYCDQYPYPHRVGSKECKFKSHGVYKQ